MQQIALQYLMLKFTIDNLPFIYYDITSEDRKKWLDQIR